MSATLDHLKERFAACEVFHHSQHGDETFVVKPEGLLGVAKYLKYQERFEMLMDLTAVDFGSAPGSTDWSSIRGSGPHKRFEMVYHFYSLSMNKRIRLKVPVDEFACEVDSLTPLWKSADWYEREVWDMFGIRFLGHPNLKRLLMYEKFEGHPLRKDYPVNKRQPLAGPLN